MAKIFATVEKQGDADMTLANSCVQVHWSTFARFSYEAVCLFNIFTLSSGVINLVFLDR